MYSGSDLSDVQELSSSLWTRINFVDPLFFATFFTRAYLFVGLYRYDVFNSCSCPLVHLPIRIYPNSCDSLTDSINYYRL